jgi:hypothetical protein
MATSRYDFAVKMMSNDADGVVDEEEAQPREEKGEEESAPIDPNGFDPDKTTVCPPSPVQDSKRMIRRVRSRSRSRSESIGMKRTKRNERSVEEEDDNDDDDGKGVVEGYDDDDDNARPRSRYNIVDDSEAVEDKELQQQERENKKKQSELIRLKRTMMIQKQRRQMEMRKLKAKRVERDAKEKKSRAVSASGLKILAEKKRKKWIACIERLYRHMDEHKFEHPPIAEVNGMDTDDLELHFYEYRSKASRLLKAQADEDDDDGDENEFDNMEGVDDATEEEVPQEVAVPSHNSAQLLELDREDEKRWPTSKREWCFMCIYSTDSMQANTYYQNIIQYYRDSIAHADIEVILRTTQKMYDETIRAYKPEVLKPWWMSTIYQHFTSHKQDTVIQMNRDIRFMSNVLNTLSDSVVRRDTRTGDRFVHLQSLNAYLKLRTHCEAAAMRAASIKNSDSDRTV